MSQTITNCNEFTWRSLWQPIFCNSTPDINIKMDAHSQMAGIETLNVKLHATAGYDDKVAPNEVEQPSII